MSRGAYYNENDKHAAAWLRELIAEGLIPDGWVDERSICDVCPEELSDFTQHHFFAGIGGWALAGRMAGWPDGRRIFTGSCPCQPFSLGNNDRKGLRDVRHLWPFFAKLISFHLPEFVFGEQVDDAIPLGWLDEVFADLEMEGYACASAVLPTRAYGAEHWRDRIFWLAHARSEGRQRPEQIERVSCSTRTPLAIDRNPLALARNALAGDFSNLRACDGLSVVMERRAIKGFGNAIVPQVAAEFILACEEALAGAGPNARAHGRQS